MVTQSKIAELAGVSRSTVERVLNNRGDVNSTTREKVMEIARLLDYHPNRAGQTLAIRRKNLIIGCIIIDAVNQFYMELNKGIEEMAREYQSYGVKVLVRKALFNEEEQLRRIDELLEENINALVIQPVDNGPVIEKLRELDESGIPIVTLNTDISDQIHQLCYVGNDFYLCGMTAANILYLVTGGVCKIGIVNGFADAKAHYDRIEGFREFIGGYPEMRLTDIVENQDDELESYHVTKTMLEKHPEIDAVFIVAGGVQGACRAIKEFGERKISVISFDDLPETKKLVKEGVIAATICQQPVRQSKKAMSVLFDYFVEGKRPEKNRFYTDILIKVKANI